MSRNPAASPPISAQYCSVSPDHTMCLYSGPSPTCDLLDSDLDHAAAMVIIDEINEYAARFLFKISLDHTLSCAGTVAR